MRAVYEPRGAAREYSPLALNLYTGCDHGCLYCYGPRVLRMAPHEYGTPVPRVTRIPQIAKDLKRVDPAAQILLSFIGDPYCRAETTWELTRDALEIIWRESSNPVAILTKGGTRCLRDLGLFCSYGPRIKVGATLTFASAEESRVWELAAADPMERIETLQTLHSTGVRTWVSMEPVIQPRQTLALLKMIPFVPEIRLGKLNNYQGLDRGIDWASFLAEARAIGGDRIIPKRALLEAAGERVEPERQEV